MKQILIFLAFSFSLISFSNDLNVRYIPLPDTESTSDFKDGIDYKILYFFSYGCPYCYDFENYKQHFLNNKNKNIEFKHMPLTATPAWSDYTKAFFIGKSLNLDIRKKIFKQVHIDGDKILTKEKLYIFFSENYNVELDVFNKQYDSMMTRFREQKYERLADKYEITGTPSIVVIYKNGETFKVSPTISGGIKDMMASTIYLVTQPINVKK